MADTFQLNLGSLRSSVNLTLHTHHASRLWFGRQRSDNKPGMIGLSGFSNIINRISASAAKDDPYSDLFLIIIEDKIEESEQQLTAIDERLDQVMAMLPKQLDVGTNLSIQPLKLPLYLNSPLAFKGVYLLTRYDELVRRILLAAHIGLIDNGSKEGWLDEGAAVLRRLYGVGQRYKGFSSAVRRATTSLPTTPERPTPKRCTASWKCPRTCLRAPAVASSPRPSNVQAMLRPAPAATMTASMATPPTRMSIWAP